MPMQSVNNVGESWWGNYYLSFRFNLCAITRMYVPRYTKYC